MDVPVRHCLELLAADTIGTLACSEVWSVFTGTNLEIDGWTRSTISRPREHHSTQPWTWKCSSCSMQCLHATCNLIVLYIADGSEAKSKCPDDTKGSIYRCHQEWTGVDCTPASMQTGAHGMARNDLNAATVPPSVSSSASEFHWKRHCFCPSDLEAASSFESLLLTTSQSICAPWGAAVIVPFNHGIGYSSWDGFPSSIFDSAIKFHQCFTQVLGFVMHVLSPRS